MCGWKHASMVCKGLDTIYQSVSLFRPLIMKHMWGNQIPCIFKYLQISIDDWSAQIYAYTFCFFSQPRKDRSCGKTSSWQTSTDFAANSSCTSSDQKRPKIWRHDASSSSRWWLPNLILSQSKPCLLRVHGRRYTHMCWQDMQTTHPSVTQSSPGSWNVSHVSLAGRTSLGQSYRWWHLWWGARSMGKDRDARP